MNNHFDAILVGSSDFPMSEVFRLSGLLEREEIEGLGGITKNTEGFVVKVNGDWD